MAIEKIRHDQRDRACRCAATASTPIGSSRRGSCDRCRSKGSSSTVRGRPAPGRCERARDAIRSRIRAYAGASMLLVNANFGCGSSREHAPQAIRRRGIRAVVGESFSEIFFGNSVVLGLPCVTASHADMESLHGARRERACRQRCRWTSGTEPSPVVARLSPSRLPAAARESFLEGTWDATGLLLDRFEEVEAVAHRLPYVTGWR